MKKVISALLLIWSVFWPVLIMELVGALLAAASSPELNLQILTTLTDLVTFCVLYPVYLGRKLTRLSGSERNESSLWHFFRSHAAFVAVFAAVSCFILNELILLLGIDGWSSRYHETSYILYSGGIISQLLLMVVAAPLAEELIFRGFCYGRLRVQAGAWVSGFFSALWFGVFHGNLVQGIYAFFLGLLLALVYEKYGGLLAAVWFHACANLSSLLLTIAMAQAPQFFTPLTMGVAILVSAAVMAVCIHSAIRKKRSLKTL